MTVLGDGRAGTVPCPPAAGVLRVPVIEYLHVYASQGEVGARDQHADLADDLVHLPTLRDNHADVACAVLHKCNDGGVVLVEAGA